jgi:CheY-like chemotaxis protein
VALSRILVAEDNELTFELVRDLLESRGHAVAWARDGQLALDRVRGEAFDLLLLDLHMPRLSGRDVLREVRADPTTASIKVMLLTADAMNGVGDGLLESGVDDFLVKPFDIRDLVSHVDKLLS